MISHLVDREDPTANHLRFGRHKRWHHQAGAVTQTEAWLHVQGLKVTSQVMTAHGKQRREGAQDKEQGHTWKCLVWPGVADTDTFLLPMMVLMVELLPTLG